MNAKRGSVATVAGKGLSCIMSAALVIAFAPGLGAVIARGEDNPYVAMADEAADGRLQVLTPTAATYTGDRITPELQVSFDGKKLSASDVDFDYGSFYDEGYRDAGTYDIVVKYTNTTTTTDEATGEDITTSEDFEASTTFTINAIDISSADIAPLGTFVFDGEAIEPDLDVTYQGSPLVEGTDYEVSYEDNAAVGTATAIVTGLGNYNLKDENGYSRTKTATFEIVGQDSDAAGVALVNGKSYSTLPEAIAAANGATVKLIKDVETESIYVDKNYVSAIDIDLNGRDIVVTEAKTPGLFYAESGDFKLNLSGEGTITAKKQMNALIEIVTTGKSRVTVGEDVVLDGSVKGTTGILVVNAKGAAVPTDVVIDFNGTLKAGWFGVTVNGNQKNTEEYPIVNVGKTAKIVSYYSGVYAAGYAEYNLAGEIEGQYESGVEVRAGILNVTGGKIVCLDPTTTSSKSTPNGSCTVGAGLAVAQHVTKLPVKVNVTGGYIEGNTAVYVSNPEGNAYEPAVPAEGVAYASPVSVGIENATLVSIGGGDPIVSEDGMDAYVDRQLALYDIADQVFTGQQITPTVKVTYGGKDVTEQATIDYGENVSAFGTVTVSYDGKDATKSFTIAPADISNVTVPAIADQVWTGSEATPVKSLKLNKTYTLREGTDYTVEYANNVSVGDASYVITGHEPYFTGTKTGTFKIKDPAVEVNGKGYLTLAKAIADVSDGATIKLLQDFPKENINVFSDLQGTFIIDLNGHELTILGESDDPAINAAADLDLTITGRGTITSLDTAAVIGSTTDAQVRFNIGEGVTLVGKTGILATEDAANTEIDFAGAIEATDSAIVMENGTLNLAGTISLQSGADEPIVPMPADDPDGRVNYPEGLALVKDAETYAMGATLDSFTVTAANRKYEDGQPLVPEIFLEAKGETGTVVPTVDDFTIMYSSDGGRIWTSQAPTQVGTYTCKLVGKAGTTIAGQESETFTFTVTAEQFDTFEVALAQTEYAYTGQKIEPKIVVSGLPEGADYKPLYPVNPVKPGTYTVRVILTGNYTGEKTVEFTIVGVKVAVPTAVEGLVYNGEQQTGVFGGNYILNGRADAVDAGTYEARVTLLSDAYEWEGGATGTQTISWTIAPQPVEGLSIAAIPEQEYTGRALYPEPVVSGLPEGADYTVSYANNTEPGTATVTVTLTGNYAGTATAEFAIAETYALIDDEQTALSGYETLSYGTGDDAAEYEVRTAAVNGKAGTVWYKKSKAAKKAKKIKIPATIKVKGKTYKVVGIAKNAFSKCKKLKKVTIGKNVKTIASRAFAKAKIKSLVIPKGVTKVGAKAFFKSNVKKITVKGTKLAKKKAVKNMLKGSKVKKVKAKAKVKKAIKKYGGKKGVK